MESAAPRVCRTCGSELTPNPKGHYVDCCSVFVAPPERPSPVRRALRPWISALEWFVFESGRGTSRYARLMIAVLVIGAVLFGFWQFGS